MFLKNRMVSALLFVACASGAVGCELLATIDRSQIDMTMGGGGEGGGGGGQGGGQGGGGQGGGGQGGGGTTCMKVMDCPALANACEMATCTAGICGVAHLPNGTEIAMQTTGDCARAVCDGMGMVISTPDDADVPNNGMDCAVDGCLMGVPTSTPVAAGTVCNDGSGQICNASGQCVAIACGDGIVSGTELCDDGNVVNGDGCDSNCKPTGCGNGVVTMGEVCDDGNLVNGDGCDSNCKPTGCGNGIVTMGEACDDGNTIDGDGCESTCVPTGCGNGVITMGEGCDDGNIVDGDGCDSNCQPTGCGNGIKTMGETCDDGNKINCDGCRGNCSAVETGCADGFVCGMETCDDGNTTDADGCDSNCTLTGCGNGVITMGEDCDDANVTDDDGCDSNCTPTSCGNGVVTSGELCDDSNHIDDDGCDSNCTPTGCGNGVVTSGELCDDGNIIASDGCSNTCQVEPNYQCTIDTSPGVCILAETNCNNGIDDDGDMATDLADSDCALSNSVASCGVGESLYIYNSLDVPKFVEDLTTRDSKIVVASGGTVQKVVVRLSIEHPFDADLDIALESPQAGTVDVSSDNGEDGDDYTATIFDDTCSPPIGLATAPFTGCFAPDAPLASVTASNPDGVWTLHVTDDALGDHGTLLNWSLALCISP